MSRLFDIKLRAMRRDRAALSGQELFLFERAFEDCLDRIAVMRRSFESALLIGSPDPGWPSRMSEFGRVDVRDPGRLFAEAAGGRQLIEDQWSPSAETYDLVLAIGTLDTVNDLPRALRSIRSAMLPNGLFIGAISGGDTLPLLRAAMRAADQVTGVASPHVHPRIEASALAPLLSTAGFAEPVVDIDRVPVAYACFAKLIADLRAMGATNILAARSPRPLSRAAANAAGNAFATAGNGGRTVETFEILHFAAWTVGGMPPR
jgi:NADH dehydrogenase [ubiquinone] 1 alpha subcomplex assembly factor 5